MTNPTAGADSLVEVWNGVLDSLRDLAPELIAKLPEHLQDDPQTQHEAGRLLLAALNVATLDALGQDGDHPAFLPSLNEVIVIHQPNADTLYKRAVITPGGSYRLRGRVGSMRIARIGIMGTTPHEAGKIRAAGYYDLHDLPVDADGSFDVLLSPTKPADHTGPWWELDPTATALLLRQMAYDWNTERDAVISIERVDIPVSRPRPDAAQLVQRMRRIAPQTKSGAGLLLGHVDALRQEGFVNEKFKEWDVVGGFGGLTGQFYYETVFDLADDEALIIETPYPESHTYASLLLTNEVFETIDWVNNHSSLNGAQWQVDADNILRVVVSPTDPGVPNWLDTSGWPTGVVQGRWTEASSNPLPVARLVKVAEVVGLLPAGTPRVSPAEREQITRDRHAAYQQRIHW